MRVRMAKAPGAIVDAHLVALGLGGTGMLSMLWSIAMGHRAVGVEMRGDPFLGVHWNIREDLYHQLGLIDQMMLQRYGVDGVPKKDDGTSFSLADCFYSAHTMAGDIVADEIVSGYTPEEHIVGTIHHVEYIDDRYKNGAPNRTITILDPPVPPSRPDPAKIRSDTAAVLDGPSTFQAGAASVLTLLRRYLEAIEREDRVAGRPLRAQLFTHHRVVTAADDGFIAEPCGRLRVRIEELQEVDFKGRFVRVRKPGTAIIDLGVPELVVIAQGFDSSDAPRLGFAQKEVEVDHGDGRGPMVAQADYVAALVEILVDGRLRRRIASEFDADGKEYWVRQIAVGHENDPEVGWVLVQVPDFMSFDPIEAGLMPVGTCEHSAEYFAAYQHLLYEFFIEQTAQVLEMTPCDVKRAQMVWGPKLFSLVEKIGDDALVAPNCVVAGDSFGNGHFMTSGGAMTGMIGHASRVLAYWQERALGAEPSDAIRRLADRIKVDTEAWLKVSATEFTKAIPINFGAERGAHIAAASGLDPKAARAAADANARKRHGLMPLDPSDWRRPLIRPGRVASAQLPPLSPVHPALRPQLVRHTMPAQPPAARTGPRMPPMAMSASTPKSLPMTGAGMKEPHAEASSTGPKASLPMGDANPLITGVWVVPAPGGGLLKG